MKIYLYGNNANMAFNFCRFLRRMNIEAYVYVDSFPLAKSDLPEWELPQESRSEWVRYVDVSVKNLLRLRKRERRFLEELKECDLIHSFGEASMLTQFTNKPYLHWTYGYDLDNIPFKSGSLKHIILAAIQRKALREAGLVIYSMPHQRELVERLRLSNSLYFPFIPIDTERYARVRGDTKEDIRKEYNCDFLFAHLARQEWVRNEPGQQNKGNDKLFRAFARLVKSDRVNAVMLIAEKGRDVLESKRLIAELGIESNVEWIPALSKDKLIRFLNAVDIVFDQFNAGSAGLLVLESMSMEIPTFIYFSKEYTSFFEEPPPVINVFTEEDIYNKIIELCKNKEKGIQIGSLAREWVKKYFNWDIVTKQFIKFYGEILNGRSEWSLLKEIPRLRSE